MVALRLVIFLSVVSLASCKSTDSAAAPVGSGCLTDFRASIGEGRFHDAYLLLPVVMETLKDGEEGMALFEQTYLLDQASFGGRNEWAAILEDPRIPLEEKLRLVEAIDETVHGTR